MGAPATVEARRATPDMVGFSTGGKGEQPRSFDRTYHNWGGPPITDAGVFIDAFNNGGQQPDNPRHRRVLRALTTPMTANRLVTDRAADLHGAVEYVAPVTTTEGRFYIVGAARNGPERNGEGSQLVTASDLPGGVLDYDVKPRSLADHVRRAGDNGVRFVSTLDNDKVFDKVAELWKGAYGWTDQGLDDLRERVGTESDAGFPADQRTVFFTGAVDASGNLAAATMAEALPLELPGGKTLTIWESTEWITAPDVPINGLVSASATLTHEQIAEAHGDQGNFTILAETNRSTPAGAVARRAGMRTPAMYFENIDTESGVRHMVRPAQVLKDNVGVQDGLPYDGPAMNEGGTDFPLRSFDLYQAPPALIAELAHPNSKAIARRALSRT